jgi:hypothetical protein
VKLIPTLISVLLAATLNSGARAQDKQVDRPQATKDAKKSEFKYGFAFLLKDHGSYFSGFDSKELKPFMADLKEDALFVKKDREIYQIVDADTVAAAKAAMEPSRQIGEKQHELGKLQANIGGQQADIGKQMREFGDQQRNLAHAVEQGAREGKDVSTLQKEMAANGQQMSVLGAQMSDLGEKQSVFGKQQAALGQQQAQAAQECRDKLTKIIDMAFEKKLVKKVRP